MDAAFLKPRLDALGADFGPLDNAVEKWGALAPRLQAHFPAIQNTLEAHFPAGSAPLRIFREGAATYQTLLGAVEQSGRPAGELAAAAGFLNLRFYIYLSGFLSACQESLEKCAYNDGLDPAELVQKSYYRPYFFDRAVYTSAEMVAMLEEDLHQLRAAPRDQKGVLLAMRARKGAVSTLTESYCPVHPLLYPRVQALEAVRTQNNPAVIDAISAAIEDILASVKPDNDRSIP